MFLKLRGWVLAAVFSVFGTTLAIQMGWIGPGISFIQNLGTTAVIYGGSRLLSWILSRY